jgi:pimeloyl-ACP methyl ester carboxylesterase
MPNVQIDDQSSLYYEILGNGAPVLLIHGFMGTGGTEFPDLAPALARDYRVILPDLRGYGQSTPKPRPYGVDFYRQDGEDLAALIRHLELESVAVLGYSDGGETAFWLPILTPDRVRAVITWGATGHFDESIRAAVLSHLSMPWRSPSIDALHGAEHIPQMAQRWVHAMTGMIDRGGDVTMSRASEIQCPTLVVLGENDDLNPVVRGRAMADAIPNGKFSEYKKTGHSVHRERPKEFLRQVRRFLKKHYRP